VYTANPGCHLQIESGLQDAGLDFIRVRHPVSRIAEAVRSAKK
jgi:Fe-S oxidoreductase